MEQHVSYLAALFAGFLSFISPCVLPLVPAYISFISGVSIENLRSETRASGKIFLAAFIFVLGFSTVFVLLGATATTLGNFLNANIGLLSQIAGVILVIFGLHVMGLIRIPFLNYEARFQSKGRPTTLLGTFTVGLAFGFGWTPCIGPILGAILAIAGSRDSVTEGTLLLAVYSLGLGLPFLLTAAATAKLLQAMNRIKKHFRVVEFVSGGFLIAVGVLMIFNMFTVLSGALVRWFPWLAKLG
jgi:cytochrome c-type biogenesis protein